MTRSKRPFTLLEIMIALVILSIVGALTATQVKKLIDHHLFEKEVSLLFTQLQEAQILSATYQTDLALTLMKHGNTLAYRFSTDEPFSTYQFQQEPVELSQTSQVKFNDAKKTPLHFDIFSGGRIEPRGLLAFRQTTDPESRVLWIDLQHGALLKFSHKKPPLSKATVPAPPKKP